MIKFHNSSAQAITAYLGLQAFSVSMRVREFSNFTVDSLPWGQNLLKLWLVLQIQSHSLMFANENNHFRGGQWIMFIL
jgi:hypothetical protein